MSGRPSLRALLIEAFAADDQLEGYFSRAESAGYPLSEALDALRWSAWPEEVFLWIEDHEVGIDDPIESLSKYLGSTERAQAVLDASVRFQFISVSDYIARAQAHRQLDGAFSAGASAQDLLALIRVPHIEESEYQLERLARTRPVLDVVELDVHDPEVPTIARGLTGRMDTSQALEHLVAAGLPVERVLAVATRYWAAPVSAEADPILALVDVTAQIYERTHRPVREVIPLARERLEVRAWLPVLRRSGLGPSAAVLHLTERVSPVSAADAAHVLLEAGYTDDEVLRGLLENGVSTAESLDLLRAEGWDLAQLTTTLIRRGTLMPEVRNRLVELGVPASSQRLLLSEYSTPDVLDVVLDDAAPRGKLGSGRNDGGESRG